MPNRVPNRVLNRVPNRVPNRVLNRVPILPLIYYALLSVIPLTILYSFLFLSLLKSIKCLIR